MILALLCLVVAAAQIVVLATTSTYARRDPRARGGAPVAVDPAGIDQLRSSLQAADAVTRVQSATGLLRLGVIEGGNALLEVASGPDSKARRSAVAEFGRVARPMGEAIGFILDWPASNDTPPTAEQLDLARDFWQKRVTSTLLLDVQARLAGGDLRWGELNRASVLREWLRRASDSKSESR